MTPEQPESAQPATAPALTEAEFLRDIVGKPFDAVTVLEFMRLWSIANNSYAEGFADAREEAAAVNRQRASAWAESVKEGSECDGYESVLLEECAKAIDNLPTPGRE